MLVFCGRLLVVYIRENIVKIKKLYIPSKESGMHQLMPENPPDLYDPDTQTIHVSPEMLKRLEALEKDFGRLPESLLNHAQFALQFF